MFDTDKSVIYKLDMLLRHLYINLDAVPSSFFFFLSHLRLVHMKQQFK